MVSRLYDPRLPGVLRLGHAELVGRRVDGGTSRDWHDLSVAVRAFPATDIPQKLCKIVRAREIPLSF